MTLIVVVNFLIWNRVMNLLSLSSNGMGLIARELHAIIGRIVLLRKLGSLFNFLLDHSLKANGFDVSTGRI